MSEKLSLRLEARLDELSRLDAAVATFGQARKWPSDLEFHIKLMLEELGSNIVAYGHDDEGGRHEIEVEITSNPESVTVEIRDDGRPFDPLTGAAAPDLDAPLEDRRVGGLGIHLVRTMADEIRYRREGGKNCLTLVKRRNG